jgi:hypothetical protein
VNKSELKEAIKKLNTKTPSSTVAMVERMNATKAKVESSTVAIAKIKKSITIHSGI